MRDMKTINFSQIMICLLFCIFFHTSFSFLYAQPVRPFTIAGDEDEPPYGYVTQKGEFEGVFVDIMREACRRMNIPLDHTPYPWVRAQHLSRTGEADAIITVPTDERKKHYVYTKNSLVDFEFVAFVRKDHPDLQKMRLYKKIDDFKTFKVLDYIGNGWGEQNLRNLNVDRGGSHTQVILKLAGKRGDVFIFVKTTTLYLIKSMHANPSNQGLGIDSVIALPNILDRKGFHLLIAKNSPYVRLLPQFEAVLSDMHTDGTIKNILRKYEQ